MILRFSCSFKTRLGSTLNQGGTVLSFVFHDEVSGMWGWEGGWGTFSLPMVICSIDIGGTSNHSRNFLRGSDPERTSSERSVLLRPQSGLLGPIFSPQTCSDLLP